MPWVERQCGFSVSTAQNYMRAWERREQFQTVTNLRDVYRLMDAPSPTVDRGHQLIDSVVACGLISVIKVQRVKPNFKPRGLARRCFTFKGGLGPDEVLDALHRQNLFLRLETEEDLIDALNAAGRVNVKNETDPVEQARDGLTALRRALARMRDDGDLFRLNYPAAMECITRLEQIIDTKL